MEGVIMPTIITVHMTNMRTKFSIVQGALTGRMAIRKPVETIRQPCMSIPPIAMPAANLLVYHQATAEMQSRAAEATMRSRRMSHSKRVSDTCRVLTHNTVLVQCDVRKLRVGIRELY